MDQTTKDMLAVIVDADPAALERLKAVRAAQVAAEAEARAKAEALEARGAKIQARVTELRKAHPKASPDLLTMLAVSDVGEDEDAVANEVRTR